MQNRHLKNFIWENINKNCQFILSSEIRRGRQIVLDKYFSGKDIQRVLNDFLLRYNLQNEKQRPRRKGADI